MFLTRSCMEKSKGSVSITLYHYLQRLTTRLKILTRKMKMTFKLKDNFGTKKTLTYNTFKLGIICPKLSSNQTSKTIKEFYLLITFRDFRSWSM